jgi:trehalose 6-phosphate phosphatase
MTNSAWTASSAAKHVIGLTGAAQIAWFLDVDGTLLEIAETPDAVQCDRELSTLLLGLQRSSGNALALISGRSTAAVDALFAPLRLPVAGQHGAERRSVSGELHHRPVNGGSLAAIRTRVVAWMAERPGLLLEDKGSSLAVHFRQAPVWEEELRAFLLVQLAGGDGGLSLQSGKMVLEIKPTDADKGIAIREYLNEVPFQGRVPVFLGDDETDEAGFAMVNLLGGLSIKVGEGATVACCRLPDVAAVRAWLAAAARGAA